MLSPLFTVIFLFASWSAIWFFVFTTAQSYSTEWRQKAAKKGLTITCDDENWGGYPFRIEVTCDGLKVSRKSGGKVTAASLGKAHLVAQAYKPWHIILEFEQPLNLQLPAGDKNSLRLQAEHAPGLASIVIGEKFRPEISLLLEGMTGSLQHQAGAASFPVGTFTAKSLNVHGRQEQQSTPSRTAIGIAATAEAFKFDGTVRDPIDSGPIKLDAMAFNGTFEGLPVKWPKGFKQILRAWAANNGSVRIRQLDVRKEKVEAQTSGKITSDKLGILNGKIKAKVFNLDHVLDQLADKGTLSANDAKVAKGMFKILSGNSPNGEIKTDFLLKNSKLYFGPFKLLKFDPLVGN